MMATRRIFGYVFVMTSIITILMGCCSATVYKVGDSKGWAPKKDTYEDWFESKEYHVGDSLVFEYDRNFNDVTQVSGGLEYEFCDSSSPKTVYNTGNDVVTLTEPGFHYFITSNHGQCLAGQRLAVLVVHDPSRPIPPPPPSNINLPFGKVYNVGDSKRWSLPEEESNYYDKWSEEKQFRVGDNLLFEYDKDDDNVIEISGHLEFKYCDTDSPVAVHNTGYDLVKLTKPGVHYFISSKTGHCGAGLKLRVVVEPIPSVVSKLSPIDRFKRWLRTLRPHHHYFSSICFISFRFGLSFSS